MRYYSCIILCILLFVSVRAISADTLSQSLDITLSVNIAPPVCKLTGSVQSVDFDEITVSDLIVKKKEHKKDASFSFTDCENVNNVTISFSGDNVDSNNNLIKNKQGTDLASGVAIKLYDKNGKEIQLKENQTQEVDKTDEFTFRVTAGVVRESESMPITAGTINTSVNLNITYN